MESTDNKFTERKLFERLCEIFEKAEVTQFEAIEFTRLFKLKLEEMKLEELRNEPN